jgi:osmoprotectant transport system substrate-binding protein
MSNMFSKKPGEPRRRWRQGSLVASLAVVAVAATACGGGGAGASNASGGGGGNASGGGSASSSAGGGSGAASSGSCGRASTDPYPGLKAANAPKVTAGSQSNSVQVPQGMPGKGKPAVKIGAKNFAESTLVGELYTQALEAKGYQVSFKKQIGGSEVIDKAFNAGQIDMYPEYLGEIATSLASNKPAKDAAETYQNAKKFEQNKRDATILLQTPYQDVDIMLVKPDFCKKHSLKSAADLKQVGTKGSKVTFTAQAPSRTRYAGFKGLQEAYGLTQADFKGAPTGGSTLKVVNNGGANVADGFSTTTSVVKAVKNGKFVVLKDPKHIMGFQHVAPVVKQKTANAEGPAFKKTLNWVDSKLTLKVINQLNDAVQSKNIPVNQVAKKFLKANGLK